MKRGIFYLKSDEKNNILLKKVMKISNIYLKYDEKM